MPHTTSSDTGGGSRRRRVSRLPARLIAVCAALGAVLLAPGPTGTAEAAGAGDSDAYRNVGEPNLAADWMKNVSGGTWSAAVSLPGSHDTLSIHGVVYQEANFDDVLGKARGFLARHPGEAVVMRLRAECPGTGGDITQCVNDPSTVDHAKIEEVFGRYLSAYPGLF
ncbi:hypothetical protein [Streptomyces sp. NPDC048603]|uniref:hypothetical protein n=1 Tax=Streptomyces sp. NPDC048603 TaxID=3365577 RepID=UPI00371DDDE6